MTNKKECIKYEKYIVKCKTTEVILSANINIVDIETASIIHAESFNKNYKADSCKTSRKILNSKRALELLSTEVVNEFVYKLTPKYIYFRVSLLDEIEFDVGDKQDKKLKNALKYIEAGRMDKAEAGLSMLLDEFDGRSYVIAYNLGVVKEAQGRFNEAKNMYSLADDICSKPVDELNLALIRIDELIYKKDEAERQINAQ